MSAYSNSTVHQVSAECTIGSYNFSVSSFSVELSVNSLPIIVVSLGGEAKLAGNARAVTPDRLFIEMGRLAEFQYKPVAAFKAKITPLSGGKPQSIAVSNWIVGGIGLTDLAATGKLAVQVTLEHPAAQLATGVITRVPPATSLPDFSAGGDKGAQYRGIVSTATNLVEAFDLAFKAWNTYQRSGADTKAGGSLDSILITNEEVQKQFATLIDYKAIKKFPINRTGTEVGLAMLKAFTTMAAPTNLWNFMLSYVLSATGLSIIPTFDKPGLTVQPADIWKYGNGSLNFNIQDLSRITMQPMDMNPLRGIIIQTTQISESSFNTYTTAMETSVNVTKLGDYAELVDPELTLGNVEAITPPWWLEKTTKVGSSDTNTATFSTRTVEEAKVRATGAYNETQARLNTNGGPIAAAYIYERYKQGTGLSLLTPVIMANGSAPIYPGQRMGVTGTDFSFYVNQVKHVVDVAARQAYSNWAGTHIRIGKGGPEDKLFGTSHPYYK